jgi:hypothetical protein
MMRLQSDGLVLLAAQLLFCLILAICFLQSGLDKVLDRRGNLAFLQGHFAKTPLRGMAPFLLPLITVLELAAGALSAAGVLQLLLSGARTLGQWGALLAAASICALFFGQRVAKDYAGAAGLVPYFLLAQGAVLVLRLG